MKEKKMERRRKRRRRRKAKGSQKYEGTFLEREKINNVVVHEDPGRKKGIFVRNACILPRRPCVHVEKERVVCLDLVYGVSVRKPKKTRS